MIKRYLRPFLITIAFVGVVVMIFNLRPVSADNAATQKPTAKAKSVLELDVTINRQENARGYRKPYVAVWIADEKGFPYRTLSLWVMKQHPGPRWIPDLRQWDQADRLRELVDDTDLVDGISSATRPAGNYKISWDGLDDREQPVPPGKYILHVEAAREHGTYQIIKHPFVHSAQPFDTTLEGNVEIKSVKLHYVGTSN